MTTVWEIDIDVRVRKTLHIAGPADEAALRNLLNLTVLNGAMPMHTFQKYELEGGKTRPVERVIDNDPQIAEIRKELTR